MVEVEQGASGRTVRYLSFEVGVARVELEWGSLRRVRPVSFEEAAGEISRRAGITEERAGEALLEAQDHDGEGPEWRYCVSASGLRERRQTLEEALRRAQRLSAAAGTTAEVVDGETGEVLSAYRAGEEVVW